MEEEEKREKDPRSSVRLIAGIDFFWQVGCSLKEINDLYYPPLVKYSASSFIIYMRINSEAIQSS